MADIPRTAAGMGRDKARQEQGAYRTRRWVSMPRVGRAARGTEQAQEVVAVAAAVEGAGAANAPVGEQDGVNEAGRGKHGHQHNVGQGVVLLVAFALHHHNGQHAAPGDDEAQGDVFLAGVGPGRSRPSHGKGRGGGQVREQRVTG